MSGKQRIEKDYFEFVNHIEKMATEELQFVAERASAARMEAQKIGESVEQQLKRHQDDLKGKKG